MRGPAVIPGFTELIFSLVGIKKKDQFFKLPLISYLMSSNNPF